METQEEHSDHTRFTLLIISIALANFIAAFDATIVSVANPTISALFNILPGTTSSTLTVYVLVMAGLVLIFGSISDTIGYKKMFLTGFGIFTLGSFSCGFFPVFFDSFPALVASRAIQGIGASMITAIGPAMVAAFLPMEMRGKAMGTIFTFAGLGMALGPTVGGILIQYLSWSWIFYINIPIGVCAILLGLIVIPDLAGAQWIPGFDWAGAVLFFLGLAFLLFSISEGQAYGWMNPVIIGSMLLAICSLCLFMFCELRSNQPLLELRLFKQRNFFMINALTILMFVAFNGLVYLVPFYLQLVLKLSPYITGLVFTSFPVALMVGGICAGMLFNKIGGRNINIIGCIPLITGYFLAYYFQIFENYWYMVVCLVLVGMGSGLIWTSASNMVIHSVSKKYQGMISSFMSLSRFIPLIVGIPIFNIIFMLGIPDFPLTGGMNMQKLVSIDVVNLSLGFHQAFAYAFFVSILILIVAFFAYQQVHPDYRADPQPDTEIGKT
ncbi:MFS transporter [Methanospirillum lacunae]|uniref:MFS transporter n=1 Tax=Methanospirillum lacunae TaxID=668570 RepID=A0A2V2N0E7_9EURY|nr:MFS transporter [Methanospirillum lacunae]PWR70008.1 MFS transporter [Methanospirillum lacunae]